jgi:hypothetical protein
MERIELYTTSGEFLAVAQIPELDEQPYVIVWGERFFRIADDEIFEIDRDSDVVIYTEVSAYYIPVRH